MADRSEPAAGPTRQDLLRWAEALAGIAKTGLGFTDSLYEKERYEEILAVAGDIRVAAGTDFDADHYVDEWLKGVGDGVPGYQTPKIAVGAVVHNEAGEILLVQRADSGVWLYPTGWADIGYSAAEVAVKEVSEETGIRCRLPQPLAGADLWGPHVFAAIRGEVADVYFDAPRPDIWRD